MKIAQIDLEKWHKKHPRASKWYPDWYVDFIPEGALKKDVKERHSWPWCVHLILKRDNHRCRLCGGKGVRRTKYGNKIEVHHIVPKSMGGADHPLNLITLCSDCHKKTFKNDYKGIPGITYKLFENAKLEAFTGE